MGVLVKGACHDWGGTRLVAGWWPAGARWWLLVTAGDAGAAIEGASHGVGGEK